MASIIVATSDNNVIGDNNDLLWRLPTDMKFFKEQTMDGVVIMGRKTWESIPEKFKPLTGRINIVMTRQKGYKANGCIIVDSMAQAMYKAGNNKKIFIIGGGEIYRKSLNFVDTIYVTRVHTTVEGDTTFPELSEEEWELKSELRVKKDIRNEYDMTFQTFNRK